MADNKCIEIGNLYDLNKTVMNKVPPLCDGDLINKKIELGNFFEEANGNYYMLLCNEQKDYTVFHLNHQNIPLSFHSSYERAAFDVVDCLQNRGKILAIDKNPETGAYECWIRRSGLSYMYALFPYDAAVIEC